MAEIRIKMDRKTVVFLGAFATTAFTVLYPLGKEIFDALTIYTVDPIDWRHIFTTHGPAIGTAAYGFWQTMKARDLVPDWLTDLDPGQALGVIQDIQQARSGAIAAEKAVDVAAAHTNAAQAIQEGQLPQNPTQQK